MNVGIRNTKGSLIRKIRNQSIESSIINRHRVGTKRSSKVAVNRMLSGDRGTKGQEQINLTIGT